MKLSPVVCPSRNVRHIIENNNLEPSPKVVAQACEYEKLSRSGGSHTLSITPAQFYMLMVLDNQKLAIKPFPDQTPVPEEPKKIEKKLVTA